MHLQGTYSLGTTTNSIENAATVCRATWLRDAMTAGTPISSWGAARRRTSRKRENEHSGWKSRPVSLIYQR